MSDQIYLRNLYGKPYQYPYAKFHNIGELRQEIGNLLKSEPSSIIFYFNGGKLQNSNPIPKTTEETFITFNKIDQRIPLPKVQVPHRRPEINLFPGFSIIEPNGKPFNFNEQVDYIVNLQFSREHAEAALQYTNYNLNDAVTMLVTGVPIEKSPNPIPHPRTQKTVKSEVKAKSASSTTSTTPTKPPPPPAKEVKETKNMRDVTKSFTKEQNAALRRLYDKFPDRAMVIQVFEACDKDEAKTSALLRTMH